MRNAITKATGNHYLNSPLVEKLLNYYQMDSMKNLILFSDMQFVLLPTTVQSPQAACRTSLDCNKSLNITLIITQIKCFSFGVTNVISSYCWPLSSEVNWPLLCAHKLWH